MPRLGDRRLRFPPEDSARRAEAQRARDGAERETEGAEVGRGSTFAVFHWSEERIELVDATGERAGVLSKPRGAREGLLLSLPVKLMEPP